MLNLTVCEWHGDIFHCISQANSDRAVAVGPLPTFMKPNKTFTLFGYMPAYFEVLLRKL